MLLLGNVSHNEEQSDKFMFFVAGMIENHTTLSNLIHQNFFIAGIKSDTQCAIYKTLGNIQLRCVVVFAYYTNAK